MKKILTACFVFMFLLAVVAGCPQKSGEKKPDGGAAPASEFDESDSGGGSMTSSDDVTS